MSSILDTQRPERLLDDLDADALVAAALEGAGWTEDRLQAVDYILYSWTASVLPRQDASSVAELQAAIGRLLDLRPPPAPYRDRWRALDDALEARRLVLAAREPEQARKTKHVRRILEYLRANPETRQGDLLSLLDLGVSKSRLSQIVNDMEAHGLIDVARRGRESFLRLAPETVIDALVVREAPAGRRSPRGPRQPTTRQLFSREAMQRSRTGDRRVISSSEQRR